MNTVQPNSPLRRAFARVALAALLGLSALSLTRCRMVDDVATGVSLEPLGSLDTPIGCIHGCNDAFKRCIKSEEALHRSALRECNALPPTPQEACRTAEDRRHEQAIYECVRQLKRCKRSCYHEGAGTAGQ